MLTFCGLHNLCLPKTFFQKKMQRRGTWMHPRSKRMYEIDHFVTTRKDLKRVVDCGTIRRHSVDSDHRAIFIKIRIAKGLKKKSEQRVKCFSRDRLQDDETRQEFIHEVEEALLDMDSKVDTDYIPGPAAGHRLRRGGKSTQGALQEAFLVAEKKCGGVAKRRNPGWYRMKLKVLQKSRDVRNSLQAACDKVVAKLRPVRMADMARSAVKKLVESKNKLFSKLRAHRSKHKKLVQAAKMDWNMERVKRLNLNGGSFIGDCWKAASDIADGPDNKRKRVPRTFRDPETGEEATSAARSGEILANHLEKLLNAVPNVDQAKLNAVRQREVRWDYTDPPTDGEIEVALKQQNSGKATGDSKIPAEYYKLCLESDIIMRVFKLVLHRVWVDDEDIPQEWLEGRIKMLPKSGDLLDPGRWRSITLLDAALKIMCTILTNRLNTILATEGLETQNGFSPGRGTTDGSFCVRTMLKKRKEHGQETWVYFLDLVKAFDTVPREALLVVLAKFGVPPKMVSVLSRMLHDNVIKLQVQKEVDGEDQEPSSGLMEDVDKIIKSTAGVPQGNSASPVLFVFYIQAVLEGLDKAFEEAGVVRDKPVFRTKHDHVIHGRRFDVKRGVESVEAGESLYADDACFAFVGRSQLCSGAVVIDRHFTAFGLQVHRGRDGKKSKTECMYFPPADKRYEDADTSNVPVDGGYYTFCKRFRYLGSIIAVDLKADDDIATRIRAATHAFNMMRKVLRGRTVASSRKASIYKAIVCSVLLYGSECWAMRQDLLDKLEKFHNQCVRSMCRVTLRDQWIYHTRNRDLRKRFTTTNTRGVTKPLGSIQDMLTERNLRWAGHVARMPKERLPRALLTGWVESPRPKGRPQQTFAHGLKRSLTVRAKQLEKEYLPGESIAYKEGNEVQHVDAHELAKSLRRTTTLRRGDSGKTWSQVAQDRRIWRLVVYKEFQGDAQERIEAQQGAQGGAQI